jgi:FkbM family methyltransferase
MLDPWFHVASFYARAHAALRIPGRARGLGWLLRRTSRRRVLRRRGGGLMYYDPRIAGCYDGVVGGGWGERETHRFLADLLDRVPGPAPVHFLDVGANIGELLIGVARHPRVAAAIGFEPHPDCAQVCHLSARLNRLHRKVRVAPVALSSARGRARFAFNAVAPQASGIVACGKEGTEVMTSTVDDEVCAEAGAAYVVKIDVEGGELAVLQGAVELIRRALPVIVFEYNETSRLHFSLHRVRQVLGPSYEIFRLRPDGRLDRDLSNTWNCVAVPDVGPLSNAAAGLVVTGEARAEPRA